MDGLTWIKGFKLKEASEGKVTGMTFENKENNMKRQLGSFGQNEIAVTY